MDTTMKPTRTYKVQKRLSLRGKLDSGVKVGQVWKTIKTTRNKTVAERVAQLERTDDPDHAVRVIDR
jgi:hypothetical protein